MKVLKRDLRGKKGEIKLLPGSLDDLWHLKYIIDEDDLVFALTYRRLDFATDKTRPEKMAKRPVRLGVRVSDVSFHKFSNWLRVHGVIESGPDLGSHHTINVEVGTELSIIKDSWRSDQLNRMDEAVKASNKPRVLIVTIEEGEADIGILKQWGIEECFSITGAGGKEDGSRSAFFGEVSVQLSHMPECEAIVIAGPGFAKEDFLKHLKDVYPDMAKKSILENTSSIGMSGFQEVLRRGAVEKVAKEMRLTEEAILIEELMEEIAKDGKATYGHAEVKNALDNGAIETLLIADETLRGLRNEEEGIEDLLTGVEKARGKVIVFSTEFEPGKRLTSLGGIAAILRFRV
ncbi:MAG: mRNA surveillance protein pelota [Halobacteriota archaeon]|nr:mRNA surveillance protein pelota [Halobacteriota archaeon]